MRKFAIHALNCSAGVLALSPMLGRFGACKNDLKVLFNWLPDMVLLRLLAYLPACYAPLRSWDREAQRIWAIAGLINAPINPLSVAR